MNTYNKVTLAKGCDSCIKAKRKCNRLLPSCQRCCERKLFCRYKNQPGSNKSLSSLESSLRPSDDGISSRRNISIARYTQGIQTTSLSFPTQTPLSVDSLFLKAPSVVLTIDHETAVYLKNHLSSFPVSFVQTGATIFIHPTLYEDGLPPTLQATLALCRIQTCTIPSYQHLASTAITKVASYLLQTMSTTHTFISKLALVQSLILLQITTLFSPTTAILREQAQNRQSLLCSWVRKLYHSVPASLPASMTLHQAWVLAESCRRTIHVAHMVSGTYSVLTRGEFTLTLFVEALPLDLLDWKWEYVEQGLLEYGERNKDVALISYRELVDKWERGEIKNTSLFVELLLAACKGIRNVKGAAA
jgi:hypothetical protein